MKKLSFLLGLLALAFLSTVQAQISIEEVRYSNPFLGENDPYFEYKSYGYFFDEKSTIKEVYNDRSFSAFKNLLVPSKSSHILNAKLASLDSIFTRHHEVYPPRIIKTLNFLKNQIKHGQRIFFPLENEDDKNDEQAGLFFFKGNSNKEFALIATSRARSYNSVLHEGFPLALRLQELGYNSFVLVTNKDNTEYLKRLISQAVDLIRKNSKSLEVNKNSFALFSIGNANTYTSALNPEDYAQGFTAIYEYPNNFEPTEIKQPSFVVIGAKDQVNNVNLLKYKLLHLDKLEHNLKLVVLPELGYGFGLGYEYCAEESDWVNKALDFWRRN